VQLWSDAFLSVTVRNGTDVALTLVAVERHHFAAATLDSVLLPSTASAWLLQAAVGGLGETEEPPSLVSAVLLSSTTSSGTDEGLVPGQLGRREYSVLVVNSAGNLVAFTLACAGSGSDHGPTAATSSTAKVVLHVSEEDMALGVLPANLLADSGAVLDVRMAPTDTCFYSTSADSVCITTLTSSSDDENPDASDVITLLTISAVSLTAKNGAVSTALVFSTSGIPAPVPTDTASDTDSRNARSSSDSKSTGANAAVTSARLAFVVDSDSKQQQQGGSSSDSTATSLLLLFCAVGDTIYAGEVMQVEHPADPASLADASAVGAAESVAWVPVTVGRHLQVSVAGAGSRDQALLLVSDFGYCYNSHAHNTRAFPMVCASPPLPTSSVLDYSLGLSAHWLQALRSAAAATTAATSYLATPCSETLLHGSFDQGSRPVAVLSYLPYGNTPVSAHARNNNDNNKYFFLALHEGLPPDSEETRLQKANQGGEGVGEGVRVSYRGEGGCGDPLHVGGVVVDSFDVDEWLSSLKRVYL
jgi:hypothetical protein